MMNGKAESTLNKLKGKVKDLRALETDKTLTKEGQAADAKAVGDAIRREYQSLTLGRHTDGLIYIFKDGVPIGNGVEVEGM